MTERIDTGPAEEVLIKNGLDDGVGHAKEDAELLIPVLQDLQHRYGYLPREILEWVSRRTGISLSRMYGVITFYTQFYLEKRGDHTVRCCQGTACHVKGAPLVVETIERELGIKAGDTTSDKKFSFETVNCLGACALAPLVVVDKEYHGKMDQQHVQKIIRGMKKET